MGRKKKNKKPAENVEAEEARPRRNLAGDAKRSAVAVVLFALGIISVLGFFHSAGVAGSFLDSAAAKAVGWVKILLPVLLVASGIVLLLRKETSFYVVKLAGFFVMFLSLTGFFHWFYPAGKMLKVAESGRGGGYIGYALAHFLGKYLGNAGSLVVILALFFLGLIVAFDFSIIYWFAKLKKGKEIPMEEGDEESVILNADEGKTETEEIASKTEAPAENLESVQTPDFQEEHDNIRNIEFVDGPDKYGTFPVSDNGFSEDEEENEDESEPFSERKLIDSGQGANTPRYRKNRKKKRWIFPAVDFLEGSSGTAKGGDIEKNFSIIEKTLKDFGIEVERGTAKTGPSVTQYSFRPAVGVKISKILALQNDLALALAAHPIRIEAPIPGQSLIGIEIPNKVPVTVRLHDMVDNRKFKGRNSDLMLALGEDVSGDKIFGDLAKMPHLMIAGATGTGKSVCINSIITSLLYQNSPENLKLIMVDPKRVELSLYNGIPHLLTDAIVENSKVVNTLKWAVGEMERRYRLLQDSGSRDLTSYRDKIQRGEKIVRKDPETGETYDEDLKKMPYIVIIIDELADLMGSHGKEVEGAIVRLAQMARAVGMHLIVSTQRPSVEVITGLIKANITTRIAFQVATQIDSRTILDMGGAEKLLGNGDMLYLSASSPKPKRIQGVFVSEMEVKRVVEFLREQKSQDEPEEEMDITGNSQKEILEYKEGESDSGDEDKLVSSAKEEIMRSQKASASFLQRRLRIGYARAARLLDILEEQGVVGPANGAKPREIYGLTETESPSYEDAAGDQEKRDKWEI